MGMRLRRQDPVVHGSKAGTNPGAASAESRPVEPHLNSTHKYDHWHKLLIKQSPRLQDKDKVPAHKLCRKIAPYMERETGYRVTLTATYLILAGAFCLWFIPVWPIAGYARLFTVAGIAYVLLLLFFSLPPIRNQTAEKKLLKKLLDTFAWIESEHCNWRMPMYRRKACRKLEDIARSIDRMPQVVSGGDYQSHSHAVARAVNVAAGLRELKKQVLLPDKDAWDKLEKELLDRLDVLLKTGWWNWPEHDPEDPGRKQLIRSKRWRTARELLTASALLALGIWLTTLPKPTGIISASIALSAAATVFRQFGLELTSLNETTDLAKAASNSPK